MEAEKNKGKINENRSLATVRETCLSENHQQLENRILPVSDERQAGCYRVTLCGENLLPSN